MSVTETNTDDSEQTTGNANLDGLTTKFEIEIVAVDDEGERVKVSVKSRKGNKKYIAQINDNHEKYDFDRDFEIYQKPGTSSRASGSFKMQVGEFYEYRSYSHSGKNSQQKFFRVVDINDDEVRVKKMSESELEEELTDF